MSKSVNREFYIRTPKGEVKTYFITTKEFMELTGIGKSAAKKKNGRIKNTEAFTGCMWSKSPTGFPEFSSGPTVFVDYLNPDEVSFKVKGEKKVMLPNSLSKLERMEVKRTIDNAIQPIFEDMVDDFEDKYEDYLYIDKIEGVIIEGEAGETDIIDNERSKVFAEAVAEASWEDIVEAIEPYKELGAKRYNLILKFAKQQSHYIFSYIPSTDIKQQEDISFVGVQHLIGLEARQGDYESKVINKKPEWVCPISGVEYGVLK